MKAELLVDIADGARVRCNVGTIDGAHEGSDVGTRDGKQDINSPEMDLLVVQ